MDPPADDAPLLAGRYRVGGLLGQGGMADVHDGVDTRLDRPVAVKLLRPGGTDEQSRLRFAREARAAARLSHPNVVGVYDTGEDGDLAFMVMERLPGTSLADWIRAGPLDEAAMRRVGLDVLGALGAAQAQGLVHRDIKPGNILLTEDGMAKVADFGIAKAAVVPGCDPTGGDLTATGMVMGTAAYLAPERIEGEPATARSDLYALGIVLYEALAGQKPFRGDNPVAIAAAVQAGHPEDLRSLRPDIDPGFAAVIGRAMAPHPADRWAGPADMASAIRALPPLAPDPEATRLLEPRVARTAVLPVGAAALGAGAGAATAAAFDPTRVAVDPSPAPGPGPSERRPAGNRAWAVVGLLLLLVAVGVGTFFLVRHLQASPATSVTTAPTTAPPVTASASTTTPATTSTSTSTTVASTTTSSTTTSTTTAPATTSPTDPGAQQLQAVAQQLSASGSPGGTQLAELLDGVAATPLAERPAAASVAADQVPALLANGMVTRGQAATALAALQQAENGDPSPASPSVGGGRGHGKPHG